MDLQVVDDNKSEEPYPNLKLEIGSDGEWERDEMSSGEEEPDEMSVEEEECDEMSGGEEECTVMSSSSSSSSYYYSSSEDSTGYTSEDTRLFDAEYKRSGAYDFDPERGGAIKVYHRVVFENSDYATAPETDGELVERLSRAALEKHNDDKNTSLEFVRAVKANWSLGGGNIFSITLEAKDPRSEPIPFHATVVYVSKSIMVMDVNPKP